MIEKFSQQLHQIITLSQQILLVLSNEIENSENSENNIKEVEPEQLIVLNTERDTLIKGVFNKQQSQYYSQHLDLINQIVKLEHQLIQQAKKNKLAFRNSLLKIKKNQKAANSYSKY